MDRIPEETLCDIFRECLDYGILPFSTSISALLAISHVCRAWRTIALSHGDLWSYMCIELKDSLDERKLSVMKDVFDTWLLRSGCSPLNITLNCYWCEDEEVQSVAGYMIKALEDQQHRWKDMTIKWHGDKPSELPDVITLNNMPLIMSLNVDVSRGAPSVVVDISRCLRLEKISVRGADVIPVHNPIETLRTSSLVFDSGNPKGLRSCLSFLRAAPNLKQFTASFMMGINAELDTGCSHLSHQLRNLRVHYEAASRFIDSVTLPSLQALDYEAYDATYASALLRFIQRSMPPLTFLKVQDMDEETLLPVLRLVPSLTDLRTLRGLYTQLFFQELAVPHVTDGSKRRVYSAVVCPELVSLRLCDAWIQDSESCSSALIHMAKSRREVLGTFDEVDLGSGKIDVAKIDQHTKELEREMSAGAPLVIRSRCVPPDPFSEYS